MGLSQSELLGEGVSDEVNPLCFPLGDPAAKVGVKSSSMLDMFQWDSLFLEPSRLVTVASQVQIRLLSMKFASLNTLTGTRRTMSSKGLLVLCHHAAHEDSIKDFLNGYKWELGSIV